MRRKRKPECGPNEVPCPKCGNNPVNKVVVYEPFAEDSNAFGLAFAQKNGQICCSFSEGRYQTKEAAKAAIAARSFSDFCADEDNSWVNDQDDMIGDQDPVGDCYPDSPRF